MAKQQKEHFAVEVPFTVQSKYGTATGVLYFEPNSLYEKKAEKRMRAASGLDDGEEWYSDGREPYATAQESAGWLFWHIVRLRLQERLKKQLPGLIVAGAGDAVDPSYRYAAEPGKKRGGRGPERDALGRDYRKIYKAVERALKEPRRVMKGKRLTRKLIGDLAFPGIRKPSVKINNTLSRFDMTWEDLVERAKDGIKIKRHLNRRQKI